MMMLLFPAALNRAACGKNSKGDRHFPILSMNPIDNFRLSNMNFQQLRFVIAVAESGSFTSAAAGCSITQPALSSAVAQLEDELGMPLFTRTTRKVGLTPFGLQLLPEIRRVLDARQNLVDAAKSILAPGRPLLRIGMSPLLDSRLVRIFIEPFQNEHPDMEIIFREMNMADLNRLIGAGRLDFVLGVSDASDKGRQRAPLYSEPLLYIPSGGKGAGRAADAPVRVADIADEVFVMVPDACGLARTVRSLFRAHRRALKEYSGEAMSYQVLEQWASLGVGAAILPKSKLTGALTGARPIMDKKGNEVRLSFEATWNRTSEKIEPVRQFMHYLKTVVPALSHGVAT